MCVAGFNEEAWDHVCQEFNKETGKNYDKMELKRRVSLLQKRHRILKPLYDEDGFGWDYRRKMVVVEDDVWQELLQAFPEIQPYRRWGCPFYEELSVIFTEPIATGEHAISSGRNSSASRSNGRNRRGNCRGAANSVATNVDPATNPSSSKKSKGTAPVPQSDEPSSASHCVTILNGMEGVDRRLCNAALDLFQNEFWRNTFLSLKSEKRLNWLKAMLPNAQP
ncbi:hypothetical protein Tsubulata_032335 [Turnera subulata]|uniref:Myb/SANT-like domain-containing protein n=1 Tax=Turnera subulata TaxID=218843 RepID=A0A9Q0FVY8_9ROSI|nr:hypothetical protein Tsubulata_032335 [Turnera subulata]